MLSLHFRFFRRWMGLGAVGALASGAFAADWPRWRGPAGDGHVPASQRVPAKLPTLEHFAWKVPVGPGHGSPVVSGGVVYLLDAAEGSERVNALDAATGRVRWRVPLDQLHKDNQSVPGPRSTPLVDGDRLYVQSCRGEFRCLDAVDGRTLWRVNFVTDFQADFTGEKGQTPGAARHGYSGSPWISGERIFVGVGGRDGAGVVCFSKYDGKVIWKSQNDVPGYGGPVLATVAGLPQVLSFTAEAAIGLRSDTGEALWRVPVKTSFGRHVASPIVLGDLVVVGSHQAGNLGLRISRDGKVCKAETAWSDKRNAINFSSPVLVAGHLYGLGPAGMMFCVDALTGVEKWTHEISRGGQKAQAQFLVMADRILVLNDLGELQLVAADPTAFRLISRLKVSGDTWCSPAYADGFLFLRDAEELICVNLLP